MSGRPCLIKKTQLTWPRLLLGLPAVSVIGLLFLLPYTKTLLSPHLLQVLRLPRTNRILLFTLWQASLSTLLSLAIGIPAAWFFRRASGIWKHIGRSLAAVPFAIPPVLMVLGFILFFGNAGHLNRLIALVSGNRLAGIQILYSPKAIVLAHAFYNFPLVLLLVGDTFTKIEYSLASRAYSLGASPFKALWTVFLPLSLPSLFSASLLVFIYCFTSFAIVLVLGGGPGSTTIAVEIYRYARMYLEENRAVGLASLEIIICLSAYILYSLSERTSRAFKLPHGENPTQLRGKKSPLPLIALALLSILILGPLLSIPLESFIDRSSRSASILGGKAFFSLRIWRQAFPTIAKAAMQSLQLALMSSLFALLIGIPAVGLSWIQGLSTKTARALGLFCLLPIVSSGIVLSQAWIHLFGTGRKTPLPIIALLQATTALPFVYRSILNAVQSLPEGLKIQGESLGASPPKAFFTLALPAAFTGVKNAFGIAMAISLGELGFVLMLADETFISLPIYIYRASATYHYENACAAGSVLILLCVLAFGLSHLSLPGARNETNH